MTDRAREAKKAYDRKWRAEHRDHINSYSKQWRDNNKDKIKEYQEAYWERKAAAGDPT